MTFWKVSLLAVFAGVFITACNVDDAAGPRLDVTLEPSPIARYEYQMGEAAMQESEPETVILAPPPGVVPDFGGSAPTDDATADPNTATDSTPDAAIPATEVPAEAAPSDPPAPMPTSNFEEIQAITDNPTLLLAMEMETTCFLANDFIPFRLIVTSLETESIYFYRNGRLRLSINNSPLGPNLASLEPTIRDDFVDLQPNDTFVIEEEDLGLWVQSLGPDAGVALSPTGLGLPTGNYWVTFVYDNDQDGLREQPDGTFLIERAAWRGTIVAPEVRFSVVDNLSEC